MNFDHMKKILEAAKTGKASPVVGDLINAPDCFLTIADIQNDAVIFFKGFDGLSIPINRLKLIGAIAKRKADQREGNFRFIYSDKDFGEEMLCTCTDCMFDKGRALVEKESDAN